MKTLIIGAGPLGSLYTYLIQKGGHDVTLLARNDHFNYLKENGLNMINEFTSEVIHEKINVIDELKENDFYDLVIVIMRKNKIKSILPQLKSNKNIKNILFLGNNAAGFDEYFNHLEKEKILMGFPGGGGSRIDHVVHFIDSEKPSGNRIPIIIGEVDGKTKQRTKDIIELFESSQIPVKYIDDIDGWLKYHAVFINPVAGALIAAGDNYKLAQQPSLIKLYIRAIKEGSRVLKKLEYKKSYNPKLNMIKMLPEGLTVKILQKVFDSKFAEIAMMMHVNAAKDEMIELGNEILNLKDSAEIHAPHLDKIIGYISLN